MIENSFLTTFAQKEAKRFKLKVGVFLLLIEKGQILLLRRYRTGIDDGKYVVPMGGHDGQEKLTTTLIREAKEETNIGLQLKNVSVCHIMHRFHAMPNNLSFEQLDVFFRAQEYEGVIKNMEPTKCDELKFHPIDHLPENTAPFIRHAIQCTLKGELFSEFGWEHFTRGC